MHWIYEKQKNLENSRMHFVNSVLFSFERILVAQYREHIMFEMN